MGCTQPHSEIELNLLDRKFEIVYTNFSSVRNKSNKVSESTLSTSIQDCCELTIELQTQSVFKSLKLASCEPKRQKLFHAISLSRNFFEKDPDYQEIPEDLILN